MVAVFVYMATELAPSHTHSRVRNLQHCFMFALGLLVSSMAGLSLPLVASQLSAVLTLLLLAALAVLLA